MRTQYIGIAHASAVHASHQPCQTLVTAPPLGVCGRSTVSEGSVALCELAVCVCAQASCGNKCVKPLKLREARETLRRSSTICQMAATS